MDTASGREPQTPWHGKPPLCALQELPIQWETQVNSQTNKQLWYQTVWVERWGQARQGQSDQGRKHCLAEKKTWSRARGPWKKECSGKSRLIGVIWDNSHRPRLHCLWTCLSTHCHIILRQACAFMIHGWRDETQRHEWSKQQLSCVEHFVFVSRSVCICLAAFTLIPTGISWMRYCYPHFADGKTEIRKVILNCLSSYSK